MPPVFGRRHWALAVVELGADELQPAPGDAVGAGFRRRNRFLAPQFSKELQVEARIAPAVAGQALDGGDLFTLVFSISIRPPCASRCSMRCSPQRRASRTRKRTLWHSWLAHDPFRKSVPIFGVMRCAKCPLDKVPGKTTKAAAARHRGTGFQVFLPCLATRSGLHRD